MNIFQHTSAPICNLPRDKDDQSYIRLKITYQMNRSNHTSIQILCVLLNMILVCYVKGKIIVIKCSERQVK
jgi:hypothetical protein